MASGRDFSHYQRTGRTETADQWQRRLKQIEADFPGILDQAAVWVLDDDEAFVRLARDLIAVGLAVPGRLGPRPRPAPADARREWERLTDAATRTPTAMAPESSQDPPESPVSGARTRSRHRCENCARAGHRARAYTADRTTVAGRLDDPMFLCRWCCRRVTATGILPSGAEVAAHAVTGRKVPIRASSVFLLGVTRDEAVAILTTGFTGHVTLHPNPPGGADVVLKVELPPDQELRRLLDLPTNRFTAGNERWLYAEGLTVTAAFINQHARKITPLDRPPA